MVRSGIAAGFLACVALALGGCAATQPDDIAGNIIDDARIENLLLSAGDPDDAVQYFEKALLQSPGRAEFRRGLALSFARAGRHAEAAETYHELIARNQATPEDRLDYAAVAARLGLWDEVNTLIAGLPDQMTTVRRHLIEAIAADHQGDWERADAAYAAAEADASGPARVLNNWGVSLMARGDFALAEATFTRALSHDPQLFNTKNNLAMVRGLQGNFRPPSIPMSETERAHVLNNLGMIAMQQGQGETARGLLAAAIEAHPQHYTEAASRLEALERSESESGVHWRSPPRHGHASRTRHQPR